MQEQRVSFSTAALAKEKSFDWSCDEYYQDSPRAGTFEISNINNNLIDELHKEDPNCVIYYACPTQSLLQKWLREVHNIETEVYTYISSSVKKVIYRGQIVKHNRKEISKISPLYEESKEINKLSPPIDFNTYEECSEELLFQALKMI